MISIVIAEDDFRVAHLHERFLSTIEGVKVVGKALNAKETMELLYEKKPDLLLLDVYMPDRLGSEILRDIREVFNQLDIIMITAANEKAIIDEALKYGVHDYIIKPISIDRFNETIHDYKQKRKIMQTSQALDQAMVDQLVRRDQSKNTMTSNVPKGIDPITLDKVKNILGDSQQGITAEQVSEILGSSKTTARRYLEYLISVNEGTAEMRYGKVGRPERKYFMEK
ncbi:response regulator [Pseudalkalibacillus berkeleyi]|uniref:Transcriptional regulatory protein n=1 Tax=Pseudalkalibacillus berkeleyi TaxID=1069813 RepID=A0ABS9H0N4_9BACL|nr:response regulator [Pseudalkalibacillus berkeleyi]MCF6138559.1 response regulator [Pseudalkalibacillus berkeleyi]